MAKSAILSGAKKSDEFHAFFTISFIQNKKYAKVLKLRLVL
jgi:hypothetical protein